MIFSFSKRDERDFRFLAEVVQEVFDLKVPPSILQHNNIQAPDKLPELVQFTNSPTSESDVTPTTEGVAGTATRAEINSDTPQVQSTQSSSPSAPEDPEPPLEINARDLLTRLTCKICFSTVVGIIFLPCGHLVCCVTCAPAMVDCPICRKIVNSTVQVFL